jgi:hypothetical protein
VTTTPDPDSPHALSNLPDLERWTDEALLRDFAVNIEREVTEGEAEMTPDTVVLRAEILRRMGTGTR